MPEPLTPTGKEPSSEPQPGEPSANPNPSPPAPSSQAPKLSEIRYTAEDGVPEWAVGRTPTEVAAIAEQLRQVAVTGPTPASAKEPSPSVPTPSTKLDFNQAYSDPEGFGKALEAYVDARTEERLNSASATVLTPLASMARSQSINGKHKDVWTRFGPEIDEVMTKVPPQNKADPSMWDQAAEMIAGRHWRDLASAEAERKAGLGAAGTIPTDGAPMNPTALGNLSPIHRLFAENDPSIQSFKREGMDAAKVIAHASAMGHTEAAYAEMLKSRRSIRAYVHDNGRTSMEPVHA